jgi:hypothetical protein
MAAHRMAVTRGLRRGVKVSEADDIGAEDG